jgi:exodeoxyribonuclease VII small subunit
MSEELSFEQSLAELERVVERLQQSDVPLDEAIELYRRGTVLADRSERMLSEAELQVQQLTQAVRERFTAYDIGEDADTEGE